MAVVAPASPADPQKIVAGTAELLRLGFSVLPWAARESEGYFAGSAAERRKEFLGALADPGADALIALRGGYGSNYLLGSRDAETLPAAKALVGYSDLTTLQTFLWQRLGWVSFYGPMLAAGFDAGAGKPGGYDEASFLRATGERSSGWTLDLQGECLEAGEAQGRLLGGCLTLLEATIGTPWQFNGSGAILVLEDRAMKPYQVDRVLMHLVQAGVLAGIQGIVLGDFPECAPPVAGSPTVRDVCRRILGGQGLPVVYGAPVGHTARAMLTLPLGVEARLVAEGGGTLEILEPAVV
ncbi:MAG: LD-carboxypeptidase [Acidobacteriia bacterium]|nr:LD-carboxypeptidase [Terriglobia bacterium]